MDPVENPPSLPTSIASGPNMLFLASLLTALQRILIRIAVRLNESLPKDGTEAMSGPLTLMTYTIATIPTASSHTGAIIYVSDESAGQRFQGSHGGSWVFLG